MEFWSGYREEEEGKKSISKLCSWDTICSIIFAQVVLYVYVHRALASGPMSYELTVWVKHGSRAKYPDCQKTLSLMAVGYW